MDKCININNGKVKEIAAKLGVIPAIAAIRMETWMDNNGGKIPTAEDLVNSKVAFQNVNSEGIIASEKTIRDLSARLADRIGIPIEFESDRTKMYKGKIESGMAYVNLAYATLDTPIHEILGHPIIRAIKNRNSITKEYIKNARFGYELEGLSETEIDKKIKELENQSKNQEILYQNLLKELETGKGKEVLDRIKRDYIVKSVPEIIKMEFIGIDEDGYTYEVGTKIFETKKEALDYQKKQTKYYSLEEQQEEAIVELLGLMTAEKLDNAKDGKLISLLKRLLKEMKSFMRTLFNQKEIEIDKLPDNMTVGDLSDLLAYSNSKLILPGYSVEYTTPDNMVFKTYAEASNHVSKLARNIEDVDLDNVTINLSKNTKVERILSTGKYHYYEKKKDIWYNTAENTVVLEKEVIEEILNELNLTGSVSVKDASLEDFIEKNKQYEQSKEIIEEWKKVNNIVYNPEEVYSRGQEFISVIGAYSNFDVNLMMQNLLQHIEDNQKAGGKFAISAITKPIDKRITHIEGEGGKLRFKIFPTSDDILWASNTDVYSGSVWDASEKVSKGKQSELLGVSYVKYPQLSAVETVQPNLAYGIDRLNHSHNELGIVLKGNNFRLEYDENVPYTTKKIINSINAILDQKYGNLIKPEIKETRNFIGLQLNYKGDPSFKTVKAYEEGIFRLYDISNNKETIKGLKANEFEFIDTPTKGIQPTQTDETLKESITSIKRKVNNLTPEQIKELNDKVEKGEITDEEEYNAYIFNVLDKINNKEYTEQALVNTKIARLKEIAKAQPRSLIRSQVVQNKIIVDNPVYYDLFDEPAFQKVNVNTALQQNAVDKITSFQGKQTQFDTYYTVEGFDTKLGRASAAAKKVIQGREQYKTEEEVKQQEKFMGSGTFLHDIMSEIARREFPEENKHRAPMDITPDMSSYYTTMEEFMAPIIKEAKDNGDVLLTEVFVGNLKTEKGGTIDLLAVTPKGNYRIYDLKNRYRADKTNLSRYNKIGEFSRQLEIYKQILEDGDEKLGIPKGKVESTLVLENKVSYNDAKGVITKINGITVVAPDFLMTTDDKINNLIVKLTAQLKILAEKAKQDTNTLEKETTNKLLKSKMELLQGLQLRQDVNSLIEHAEQELAYIEIYLRDETNLDTTNVMSELDLYTDLVSFVDTTKLTPEMDTRLGLVQYKATKIKNAFLERQKEVLVVTAGEMDYTGNAKLVDNLFKPVKDISAIKKFVGGIAGVDNALVQTAFRVYNNSIEKVAEKMDTLKEKFLGVLDRYEKVVGSKNFDILLNNKKTALVTEFSSEFWDEFSKNRKTFNLEWAKENLDYDKEAYEKALADFDAYQDAYKETQMKRLEVIQSNKGFVGDELEKEVYGMYWAIREKDKNQWLEQNKNNPYQYFKAKSKWTDPKWKEIKQGKYKGTAVEEFYDFYTGYMKKANEIAPEKIRPGFIANFSQDFLERVSNLGMIGAIKGGWSELLNSLELKYDEALFGKVDPNTGEQERGNFIPGMSSAKQAKSTDLGKSFLMFMEGVFRYDEINKIESTMSNIKYQLRNIDEQRIDSQGNPVVGGVSTKVNPTKGVSEQLEYMIDALIYGVKQKDEGSFQITGNGLTSAMGLLGKGETKKIAYAKLVDKMIRYTGLRNLAFNMFAPPVNILGGTANMYMSGAGGLDYTAGDLTKAIGLITAGKFKFQSPDGQKMRLILEWLRLDKEKIDRDIFRKVTNNTPSAILDEYNGMTGMRESEAAMVESGAAAMLLSGKHHVKFEDFDVVDGKLVVKKEFSSIARSMFKQKVMAVNGKTIGSMNPDDVMLAKKYMLGRMLMQHRSWLPAQAFARFGEKQFNYVLERYTEGRYRVAVRAFKAIMAKGVAKGMESLTPEEEAAAKEAFAEATIILGTMLLLAALHAVDDDDKKEAWYKMTNKVSTRVLGELFFFADPTLQSQWTILQSPAASTSTIEDAGKLIRDIFREASADFQEDPDKVRKAAKPGKRAIKMLPYLSKTKSFLDDLYNVDEKDK